MTPGRGSGRPLVVYCAGVRWHDVRGTDKHMAVHLAEHVDVLWVDPPLSVAEPLRTHGRPVLRRRAERVHPGVVRLVTPAPPFPGRPPVRRVSDALLGSSIRQAVRTSGRHAAAMVVSSPDPRFHALPDAFHVYYATDDFVAGASLMGVDRDRLVRDEAIQVRGADLVVGVSPQVIERWSGSEHATMVLPNGCDTRHFAAVESAPRPVDVTLPAPIAGVVGQLSSRLDLATLEAVADAGVSLLLVGPLQADFEPERVRRLLARDRVQWVGPKTFESLPGYLGAMDVGLTPYTDTPFNRASFPLKTLEYLAAGLPVVSTPLPAVDALGSRHIRTGLGPAAFVAAVDAALAEAQTPESRRSRREFAAAHSWQTRAGQLLEAMGLSAAVTGTASPDGA